MIKYIKNHPERSYLNLMQKILLQGSVRSNERTGTGTISLFGESLKIDLSDGYFPILHTRRMSTKLIQDEFNWYLSGSTDVKKLRAISGRDKTVWDANTTQEFIDMQNLAIKIKQDDLGASYGFQFKHFGATYIDCETDYTGQGIDQVEMVIKSIKENPEGRRHIVSLWNVDDLDKMTLPPCLRDYQFYVRNGTYLDCKADQRSSDFFLAGFWNIHQVAYFTYHIAKKTGYKPGAITMNYGDIHIYQNQVDTCLKQIELGKLELPYYQCDEDFNMVSSYNPISNLTAKMAV
jgi:thymidylate synthase